MVDGGHRTKPRHILTAVTSRDYTLRTLRLYKKQVGTWKILVHTPQRRLQNLGFLEYVAARDIEPWETEIETVFATPCANALRSADVSLILRGNFSRIEPNQGV